MIDGAPRLAYVPSHETDDPNDTTSLALDVESGRGTNQSLHDEILSRLRDHIVEGNIPEGGRVPERQLCEMLDLAHAAARGAQGAGGRRAGRAFAQPRRAGAGFKRTGPRRIVRRDGRARGTGRDGSPANTLRTRKSLKSSGCTMKCTGFTCTATCTAISTSIS